MLNEFFKKIIAWMAAFYDLKIVDKSYFERIIDLARIGFKVPVLDVTLASSALTIECLIESPSQIGADIICLHALDFKKFGFFVEFGAYDGYEHSNTYLLEHKFGWNGILVEPCRRFHEPLNKNRPQCTIETSCVAKESGKVVDFVDCCEGELSTQKKYIRHSSVASRRQEKELYKVQTMSLLDLLIRNAAPKIVDFLSIDVEGGELEILEGFDFSAYIFRMVAVEHGWTDNETKIDAIMLKNGYLRKYHELSKIDAWYFYDSW